MPLILAIEPDKRQAAQLKVLVRNRLRADLVLADTTELALEAIGNRIPDLVLVPALLSPEEDGALAAALRVIAAAAHVQTLTIPVFSASHAKKASIKTGGLLSKLLGGGNDEAPEGCDPAVFADQIAAYLADAAASRESRDYWDGDEDVDNRQIAAAPTFTPVDNFTPSAPVERKPEPKKTNPAELSILRDPGEAPVAEPASRRTPGLDALFQPPVRKPAPEQEPEWPVYEPPAETIEEDAPQPEPAPGNDWAPPADQSIALDLPAGDERVAYAAAEATPIEQGDPAEEPAWAEPETAAEAEEPPPTWTPPPGAVQPSVKTQKPAAPPDLLAEFTADLRKAAPSARAKPAAAAPPPQRAKPVTAPPAPRPMPPKSQPAPGQPAPRPMPSPKQPIAAQPATGEMPPPEAVAAPPPLPSALKPKPERPEWTALIDSLRQDMERMRHERGGRAQASEPAPPPPSRLVVAPKPEPMRVAAAAPVPAAPAPAAPPPAAPPPAAPAAVTASTTAAAPDAAAKRKKRSQKPTPVQDEWGFFDPQQCGFAALLAKLDEITENEETGNPA